MAFGACLSQSNPLQSKPIHAAKSPKPTSPHLSTLALSRPLSPSHGRLV